MHPTQPKILILKPSSLGDVVHALPVLRLLKRHLPESEIHWWIDSRFTPFLEGDPDLAGTIPFERRRWAGPAGWPEMITSIRGMRRQRFDWVIDLQGLARSAIFGWLANGGLFIGLDNPGEGGREGARGFYDLTPSRCAPGTHAVERYLAVLPLLGCPVSDGFQWLPERPQVAAWIREKWRTEDARWVLLLPGARWQTKRWPAAYFGALVRRLAEARTDLRFAILGGSADTPLARPIVEACPDRVLDLTGQTSLPEMVEWVRLSRLVITNDTGPMHVAAALGRPVVALFGPTDPASTGPYRQQEHVLQNLALPCVPCLKGSCARTKPLECLGSISPDRVCEAALTRLQFADARPATCPPSL